MPGKKKKYNARFPPVSVSHVHCPTSKTIGILIIMQFAKLFSNNIILGKNKENYAE